MEPLDGHLFGTRNQCFGCGPEHPHGFHLQFHIEGDEVVTEYVPQQGQEGVPTIMHGGLVATLADEVGSWVLIGLRRKFGFTTHMSSRFVAPVRLGQPVQGRGRILRESSRIVQVGVRLLQQDVEVFTSELKFAILDRTGAEKLIGSEVPEAWQSYLR